MRTFCPGLLVLRLIVVSLDMKLLCLRFGSRERITWRFDFKGWAWQYYIFLSNYSHKKDKNQQWILLLLLSPTKYCVCIKAWYILFLCATEPHCCPKTVKNTSMSLLHWVTCPFITMNPHNVVCFYSIPHTPSFCRKYTQELQMCINPQLKIVPNKYTIYSCLSDVW